MQRFQMDWQESPDPLSKALAAQEFHEHAQLTLKKFDSIPLPAFSTD